MVNPYSPPGAPIGPGVGYAQSPPQSGASVGEGAIEMLRLTRPWVMLISILCFIGAGMMLLASVALGFVGMLGSAAKGAPFPMGLLGLMYLPFAAIYVYPGVKLWKYGSAIAALVASRSPADLESALREQKSFWKYSGISVIAIVVVYVVVLVGALVVGMATAAGGH